MDYIKNSPFPRNRAARVAQTDGMCYHTLASGETRAGSDIEMATEITMKDLLQATIDEGASDLHIRAFMPPELRVHGELVPIADEAFQAENGQNGETVAAHIMEKPGKFGIKNESASIWTVSAPDGSQAIKEPGDVAVIGEDFRLDFGHGIIGEIVKN